MKDESMNNSVDPAEIAKFEAMAKEWWDEQGKFKPLHKINPCRLGYITERLYWHYDRDQYAPRPLEGLEILDLGCGGGLLCEPLTRLGANVTGVDAAPTNIEVAKLHAAKSGLDINYQNVLAEDLATEGRQYDAVLAMEIVEHVRNPSQFLKLIAKLLKPNAFTVISTLNRNPKSYLAAIIGAEYVLRWLPKGTHDWRKFIQPEELKSLSSQAELEVKDSRGMVFNPLRNRWSLSRTDLSINYAIMAVKPISN